MRCCVRYGYQHRSAMPGTDTGDVSCSCDSSSQQCCTDNAGCASLLARGFLLPEDVARYIPPLASADARAMQCPLLTQRKTLPDTQLLLKHAILWTHVSQPCSYAYLPTRASADVGYAGTRSLARPPQAPSFRADSPPSTRGRTLLVVAGIRKEEGEDEGTSEQGEGRITAVQKRGRSTEGPLPESSLLACVCVCMLAAGWEFSLALWCPSLSVFVCPSLALARSRFDSEQLVGGWGV
eukprot:3376218-Rhodomonas_salina.2